MLTCAQCEHYQHQSGDPDLTTRVCYGGPPQVINVPVIVNTPHGQKQGVEQRMVRPAPTPGERACGLFKFTLNMAPVTLEKPLAQQ